MGQNNFTGDAPDVETHPPRQAVAYEAAPLPQPAARQKAHPLGPIRPESTFAALRHPNFQLYFGGQLISAAGTWMQIVAQGWLVYELSKSETALGIVSFAAAIPALLISPWGGVVVDRVNKRSLLVVTQVTAMLMALILAWLTFTGLVQVWHIVLLAVGTGLFTAFDAPARQAFMVEMVGQEDLTNAIALNSLMFNSARIIGPAAAGVLLAWLGAGWCFLLNGLSFVAVIAGLLLMRLPKSERKISEVSPLQQLKQGVVYVAEHGEIAGLILISLVFSVFGMTYNAVLPAFVDRVLHQGAQVYGWITTASGIGAVSGALFIASNGAAGRRGQILYLANLLFPFGLLAFAFTPFLPLSLLLGVGLGLGFMLQFTMMNTLLQTRVSDEMRGRVMSLYSLTFFGMAPVGNLVTGWLAERIGLSITLAINAVLALVLAQIIMARFRSIRKLT